MNYLEKEDFGKAQLSMDFHIRVSVIIRFPQYTA